jgi:anthranilate 1,2-dioxygenase ferredoxin reductase component
VTRFVIIGAGPAGMRAAEVLRPGAPDAEILLIGDEPHLPYDRPPLSKAFLTEGFEPQRLYLKPQSFFTEQRIGLKLGSVATRIDRAAKTVALGSGERIPYDRLLLATGCRARHLPASFEGTPIHYLRSLSDAERLRAALAHSHDIVLIGGGFSGLEIAASAMKLGARVTVLEMAPRLMSRGIPPSIGDFALRLHESHGVRFELSAKLARIEKSSGGYLVKTERAAYRGDIVVAGIGAEPNTALAQAAGLAVEDGIRVDEWGRTSDPDIFAAGDATRHMSPAVGRAIRVESWQVALNHAAAVARTMLGAREAYAELPWLWTDQYDCNIQALGLFGTELTPVVRGDPASQSFTLLGLDSQSRLAAAVTVNSGRDMAVLRRLASTKVSLAQELLADPARKLSDLLKASRAGP